MIYVLILAGALWFLGREMNVPYKARRIMIGLLYVAVLALLIIAPNAAEVLGGSFGEWALLGVLGAVVFGYRRVLGLLRSRATPPSEPEQKGTFVGTEIERYARHIILREIGGPGQKRLKEAKVLVVGAGGLGSPACLYLAAAGIGTIGVVDDDVVEGTNLQRQIAHADARIGMPKVFSAETAMRAINPFIEVKPYHRRLTDEIGDELVSEYDLVLDGCDNFETRYLVNAACARASVPLVSAALTQWEGQISSFDPASGGPCYRCVFPEVPAPGLAPTCAEAGVLGPLTGVVGSMMAVEAVKVLVDAGETLRGRMLIYDALYAETRIIKLNRREDCTDCGAASNRARG